ncbi:glycosyltransferase [Mucilaginibacter sabulilitoris]|uniref:Glycosyltransferase n=1 Tax=Mucilaginibacter sabulilitoris TaxID=1173583 RepID=A0ABZ0TTX7_9SPHI|nr:glycosyltransferase [Mucilaginibacter sabulilitoris]WPU95618.1 glycosyltransferase [Mucilaginibacter sabulilitoris]
MKLLLLSTSSSRNAGGLYNSVRNLGQALLKLNHYNPTVIAYNDEHSDVDIAAYEPLPVVQYKTIGPKGLAFSLELKKKFNHLAPDIIHQQGIYLYSSLVNHNYSKKHRIPYLISPRGMLDPWILNNNPLKKEIGFKLYERSNLKGAACIHALGMPEYHAIRKFGCDNPIAVIPNGVFLPSPLNLDSYSPPAWKADDDRKILLFLSRLHPKKGLENLMHAVKIDEKFRNKWKIIIAGESNTSVYLNSLIELQDKLQLKNDILFIGAQYHADKDLCFRYADAFILPSFSEGMPMAVLEAWSYSLPAIITEECNLPEGFEEAAAIKIEPNIDSIVDGLKKLNNFSDMELKRIGNNGYNLVRNNFTWEAIAQQMEEVYNWILEKGPRPNVVKVD